MKFFVITFSVNIKDLFYGFKKNLFKKQIQVLFLGFRKKVCCKMVHSDADSKSSDADSNSSAIPVLLNSNSKKYKNRTLLSSTPTLTDCRGLLERE